jgi:GAF domain-containing protein
VDHEDQTRADRDALKRARTTIRRQRTELALLRRQVADGQVGQVLREAVGLAATAEVIAAPVSHDQLLELIVQTAAAVIDAESASLFLIDESLGDLFFEVATGPRAKEVTRFRVPLGHGIAGLVALHGQPMAVSDAGQDPRQASDIAHSVEYVPQSLLCVPLFVEDRIIGVLELLNKRGALSFTPTDMATLGHFAHQAGITVELSRTRDRLTTIVLDALRVVHADAARGVEQEARDFAARMYEADIALRETLDTARILREIDDFGENERTACRELLRNFLEYLRRRPQPGVGSRGRR